MKCNSCGAIGSSANTKCDFCGFVFPNNESTLASTASQVAAPQISFAKDSLNLITELNSTKSSGFSWWAFLFPIGYLFGYEAIDNGKKVAVVMLIPAIIISLIGYLSYRLSNLGDGINFIWVIFISYLIATRTHTLIIKGGSFNLTKGIMYQLGFYVLMIIIAAI